MFANRQSIPYDITTNNNIGDGTRVAYESDTGVNDVLSGRLLIHTELIIAHLLASIVCRQTRRNAVVETLSSVVVSAVVSRLLF